MFTTVECQTKKSFLVEAVYSLMKIFNTSAIPHWPAVQPGGVSSYGARKGVCCALDGELAVFSAHHSCEAAR